MHGSLYFLCGLLIGLILATLFYRWRHKRRPRADVHLKVGKGQDAAQMLSSMVEAINQVSDWKREAEKWKGRYELLEHQFEEEKKRSKGH